MNSFIDKYKGKQIYCSTPDELETLLWLLEEAGYLWGSGHIPTVLSKSYCYPEGTSITITDRLMYSRGKNSGAINFENLTNE